MKLSKKVIAGLLTFTLAAGSLTAFAATSDREAWNNAAGKKDAATTLENGETVYPNVYSNDAAWTKWAKDWAVIGSNYEKVALAPGKNESELNFAWYSQTSETPKVRLVTKAGSKVKTFKGEQDTANKIVLEGKNYYPKKVTVTGLKENTDYYYQYSVNGAWSEVYPYSTKSADSFELLYVGDPQIGASTGQEASTENDFANAKEYYARNDAFNWNETLKSAIMAHPNVSFMLSAGDQINEYVKDAADEAALLQQQKEYAGFLEPSVLRSLPMATTIGNHDSRTVNYKNHFNNPNAYTEEVGASVAGNDYYFTYGPALFIVINTNNYNCQTHKDLIEKAVKENPDVTWKVLMFHQDIYGSGYDHSDSDGMILRTQLTPIIDEAGIDVVLQGHDHTYSRTYQLEGDGESHPAFTDADGEAANFQSENAGCYEVLTGSENGNMVYNPEGTAYMEANSASGSKFYQLIATQQDYVATRSQSWRPTYASIKIDENSFTITTYDAATNEVLVGDNGVSSEYTIVKGTVKAKKETSGSAYQKAHKAVDSAARKSTVYSVYTYNEAGEKVTPSYAMPVSLTIPKGYDTKKTVVYKIDSKGNKTAVKGTVSGGQFKLDTKVMGLYVVAEKK